MLAYIFALLIAGKGLHTASVQVQIFYWGAILIIGIVQGGWNVLHMWKFMEFKQPSLTSYWLSIFTFPILTYHWFLPEFRSSNEICGWIMFSDLYWQQEDCSSALLNKLHIYMKISNVLYLMLYSSPQQPLYRPHFNVFALFCFLLVWYSFYV